MYCCITEFELTLELSYDSFSSEPGILSSRYSSPLTFWIVIESALKRELFNSRQITLGATATEILAKVDTEIDLWELSSCSSQEPIRII